MNINLRKLLKKYDIKVSESTVSMVLGAVVVLIVGVLAYNYFRTNRQPNVAPAEVSTTAQEQPTGNKVGELTTPGISVALPTTHTVAEGESLWTISEKYFGSGYNFVDIAQANDLPNWDFLAVGQKLTIPKAEVRVPLVMNMPALYPTVVDSRIEGDSYTVVRGDSLWSVAVRAYGDGFKWVEIAKANNLTRPSLIHAGNVLSIPR